MLNLRKEVRPGVVITVLILAPIVGFLLARSFDSRPQHGLGFLLDAIASPQRMSVTFLPGVETVSKLHASEIVYGGGDLSIWRYGGETRIAGEIMDHSIYVTPGRYLCIRPHGDPIEDDPGMDTMAFSDALRELWKRWDLASYGSIDNVLEEIVSGVERNRESGEMFEYSAARSHMGYPVGITGDLDRSDVLRVKISVTPPRLQELRFHKWPIEDVAVDVDVIPPSKVTAAALEALAGSKYTAPYRTEFGHPYLTIAFKYKTISLDGQDPSYIGDKPMLCYVAPIKCFDKGPKPGSTQHFDWTGYYRGKKYVLLSAEDGSLVGATPLIGVQPFPVPPEYLSKAQLWGQAPIFPGHVPTLRHGPEAD